MKKMNKVLSLVLALVMVLGLATTAFAASDTDHTITISNKAEGYTYAAYQIFAGDYELTCTKDESHTDACYQLQNIEWGANIDATKIAALMADLKEIEAFADCENVVEVATALGGSGSDNNTTVKAFADVVSKYLTTSYAGTSTYANEKYTIKVTGDGYYLVKNTVVPTGTDTTYTRYILEVVKNVEVSHKGTVPTVEKKVLSDDAEAQKKYDAVTSEIGKLETFEFTGSLPSNIDDYDTYYYVFTDTMSKGLTYAGNLKVTVNGVDVTDFFYAGTEAGEDDDGNATTILTVGIQDLLALELLNPSLTCGKELGEDHAEHTNECYTAATYMKNVVCESEEAGHEHSDDCQKQETEIEVGDITSTTKVVVTYKAFLNENALIGVEGNPNAVDLTFSNDPNNDGDGATVPPTPYPGEPETTTPVGKTPEDTAIVYSTKIELTKVDGNDPTKTLTGAKFSISGLSSKVKVINEEMYVPYVANEAFEEDNVWYRLKNGTYANAAPGETAGYKLYEGTEIDDTLEYFTKSTVDEVDTYEVYDITGLTKVPEGITLYTAIVYSEDAYESITDMYKLVETLTTENVEEEFTTEGWVKEDGTLTFTGLGEGEYTITEIIAPDGYNQLKDPIKVVIDAKVLVKEAEGENDAEYDDVLEYENPTAATKVTWTATDGAESEPTVYTVENGVIKIDVENTSGSTLPSTGGMGTTLFYVFGTIMVLGAGVVLVTKKRVGEAQ